MLSLNLTPFMTARGVRKVYAYLVKSGFPEAAARKLRLGTYKDLPLEYLEKLCLLLGCTPNDLLVWTPDEGQQTEGIPLAALLAGKETGLEWLQNVREMTVEELRELGRKVKEAEGREE